MYLKTIKYYILLFKRGTMDYLKLMVADVSRKRKYMPQTNDLIGKICIIMYD